MAYIKFALLSIFVASLGNAQGSVTGTAVLCTGTWNGATVTLKALLSDATGFRGRIRLSGIGFYNGSNGPVETDMQCAPRKLREY